MAEQPVEKRRYPRFDCRIPMSYKRMQKDTSFKGSLMRDLSEGGLRMTIQEFLPLNLKLALGLPLVEGLKPVQGSCRVSWIEKIPFGEQYQVGIEFLNMDPEEKARILEYIFHHIYSRRVNSQLSK